ncbi:hypothetical protein LTR86_002333 [Recurvomyces mirabilis]|nr:hypothetical protein LTR86_002333 [Recurvomyces mirabilis]
MDLMDLDRLGSSPFTTCCMISVWDLKDHVYGILGLYRTHIANDLPLALVPDYRKPLRTIYRDTTRSAIKSSRTNPLIAFSYLYHEPGDNLAFPSWVPMWHRNWMAKRDPHELARYYEADDRRKMAMDVDQTRDPDVLTIEGHVVGNIAYASSALEYKAGNSQRGRSEWLKEVQSTFKTALFDDQLPLARTLIADRSYDRKEAPSQECLEGYRTWCEFIERNEYPGHLSDLNCGQPPKSL